MRLRRRGGIEYSIVVPFHSNASYLRICLESLKLSTPKTAEILVVFNNPEESAWPTDLGGDRIRVIRIGRSIGYSAAVNAGAAEASGRVLVFCDADTYHLGDWFSALTSRVQNEPTLGAASSKLLDPTTGRINDFGLGFTEYNSPHPYRDRRPNAPQVRRDRKVQAACSASMVVRAEVFKAAGGFDESLLNFYCDIDFCLRLKDLGLAIAVVDQSRAYHRGSSAATAREAYRADVKGVFYRKNAHRIEVDMDRYFDESIHYAKRRWGCARSYLVADLTSVANRSWHHKLLARHFELASVYEYTNDVRDARSLSLIDHLGASLITLRKPILYFVDRFLSLEDNSIWFQLRDCSRDLVIDRNANVVRLADVANRAA